MARKGIKKAVEMPAKIITSHSKFQLNRARRFRDMNLQNLAEFVHFFRLLASFCQGVKVFIKHKSIIQLP